DDVGGRTVATGPQRELHRPTLGPRDHDNATCEPPGWDGPHGQARLGAGSGQNRPAFMPASVTRETWKVCTDDGTFPSAGMTAFPAGLPSTRAASAAVRSSQATSVSTSRSSGLSLASAVRSTAWVSTRSSTAGQGSHPPPSLVTSGTSSSGGRARQYRRSRFSATPYSHGRAPANERS